MCPSCLHVTLGLHARVALARAPRRFLVLRATRERCGARLGVPAARGGSVGVGAASDGAGRGRRTLRRAVGWSALAPAARALLRLVSGRLRLTGRLDACCAGLMRPCAGLVRPGSELPYPGRRAPCRFLVFRAALERCGARMNTPAARLLPCAARGGGLHCSGEWLA